jgi:glutamate-1-semialdehyde aminotransferase
VPLYFRNGCGAGLEDVDGNEYIDYVLAWGPMILGYRHPVIVEAMRRQADLPADYGAQHELEFAVSEQIQSMMPCAERVAFTSSGSEACQIAFRLARAFTGRDLILKFEGHYHGWMDGALVSYKPTASQVGPREWPISVLGSRGQVPNAVDNVVVAPWNDADAVERIVDHYEGRIAAIAMEPVLCNSGCILPSGKYLQKVRELCSKRAILLYFDEVITGFRMSLGGAQQLRRHARPSHVRQSGRRRGAAERRRRTRGCRPPNVRGRRFRRQLQRESGVARVVPRDADRAFSKWWRRSGSRACDGAHADGRHSRDRPAAGIAGAGHRV